MKKLLIFACGLLLGGICFADTALIQLGPDGRPIALPIPNTQPPSVIVVSPPPSVETSTPPAKATDVGSLPPAIKGYVYYTVGGVNLITPWSAAILAEGWDFVGKETITQGYVPLAQWWKVTAVFGGGINPHGEGSPLGGGIVDLATIPINNTTDFHIAVTGGYNFNQKHALAVLSGSVQFLK